jgi:uncharacterized protein involved in exopolysaccharide biosynthesis
MIPDTALRAPNADLDDLDVMRIVHIAWRYRFVLLAFTLLAGLAAVAVSARAPRLYQASAKLLISGAPVAVPAVEAVRLATARVLVENQSAAADTLREMGLDKPPRAIDPSVFVAENITVNRAPDSQLIYLGVRLDDPDLAAKVANRMASRALTLLAGVKQDELLTARDNIKVQWDEAARRLHEAEARVEAFKKEAQIDLARADADALLDQRSELEDLLVRVQVEKARLAKAEEELARRPRAERPERSVNDVYEMLDHEVAVTRAEVAALEKQKAELLASLKRGGAWVGRLSQLYADERRLSRLETDRELATRVYMDVGARYELASLQALAGVIAPIVVADNAAPGTPLSRHLVRNAVAAALLACFLSFVAVLLYDRIVRADRVTSVAPLA